MEAWNAQSQTLSTFLDGEVYLHSSLSIQKTKPNGQNLTFHIAEGLTVETTRTGRRWHHKPVQSLSNTPNPPQFLNKHIRFPTIKG